ncbi:MAG: hypothetical protein AAGD14_08670 [Planctomycetota bacterium]
MSERRFTKTYNLDDMLAQFEQVRKMGSMRDRINQLPKRLAADLRDQEIDDREVIRQCAIIQSMTAAERRMPEEIHRPRRARIARGSGTSVEEVDELLRSFLAMLRQMRRLRGDG